MTTTDDPFRVGDPVRVKNIPGPRMIISGFAKEKDAVANICVKWFDRRAEIQTAWWPAKMLCKIAPWTERPGYRAALEAIKGQVGVTMTALGVPRIEMADGTLLVAYIDDVLAHAHPSRSAAPIDQAEMADAAD